MFGGKYAPSNVHLSDTWENDGGVWMRRDLNTGPSPRGEHGMAHDLNRRVTVLFGGQDELGRLNDTWEWDGNSWRRITPLTNPSARSGHSMAYDETRRRVVLYGGAADGVPLSDIWEWDGSSWTQRTSGSPIPPRALAGLAFHRVRSRLVLVGGYARNDTWEIAADSVFEHVLEARRSADYWSSGQPMAYDEARARVVLFGGLGAEDTWELRAAGGVCTTGAQCDEGACTGGRCVGSGSDPPTRLDADGPESPPEEPRDGPGPRDTISDAIDTPVSMAVEAGPVLPPVDGSGQKDQVMDGGSVDAPASGLDAATPDQGRPAQPDAGPSDRSPPVDAEIAPGPAGCSGCRLGSTPGETPTPWVATLAFMIHLVHRSMRRAGRRPRSLDC